MTILNDVAKQYPVGMNEIKLKDLLTLRKEALYHDQIQTMFPPVEIGSVTLVDQVVLLLLERLVVPKVILEVGTYLGYTTNLFLKNSEANVISIDLPKDNVDLESTFEFSKVMKDGDYNDDFLRVNQANQGEIYLKNISAEENARLKLVKSDSTAISFFDMFGDIQFIFIDGGHAYDIVKSDSINARNAMKSGVIVWHDYNSNIHSDVTQYLGEESKTRKIFHVKGSLCAFEII